MKGFVLHPNLLVFRKGPFQGGSDVKLQPGNYNFPFQFPLPPHSLPTSFEGEYGSIRYWLNAVGDRPWKSNLHTQTPLFIVERVQINDVALLVRITRPQHLDVILLTDLFGARESCPALVSLADRRFIADGKPFKRK